MCIVACRYDSVWRVCCGPPVPFVHQASGFFADLRDERGLREASMRHYRHFLRRLEASRPDRIRGSWRTLDADHWCLRDRSRRHLREDGVDWPVQCLARVSPLPAGKSIIARDFSRGFEPSQVCRRHSASARRVSRTWVNLCPDMPRWLSKGARQRRFADHPTVSVIFRPYFGCDQSE